MVILEADARVQPWTMMIECEDALVASPTVLRRHVYMDVALVAHWQGNVHSVALLWNKSWVCGIESHQYVPDYEEGNPADGEGYRDNPLLDVFKHREDAAEEENSI